MGFKESHSENIASPIALSQRILRKQRREKGLCAWCGKEVEKILKNRATGKLYTTCRACSRYNATKQENRRKQRSSEGLCERCGKNPPKKGVKNCLTCVKKMSAQQKRYRQTRFFENKARSGAYRYSVKFAQQLAFLWKRQRGFCVLTGRRLNRYNAEIDHIVPRSKGGTEDIQNLRFLHRDVNQAKRALSDKDFLLLCQEVVSNNRRVNGVI
jgi:5-methylcytosine-specific restriction endonuclease McrA